MKKRKVTKLALAKETLHHLSTIPMEGVGASGVSCLWSACDCDSQDSFCTSPCSQCVC